MKRKKNYTHNVVKDKKGTEFLCPAGTVDNHKHPDSVDVNVCFEKDIPGRYAARISMEVA